VVSVVLALVLGSGTAGAQAAGGGGGGPYRPGAAGIGDPYFPLDGNGGYDVRHYLLDVRYTPATDMLVGVATIAARATQNLSRFNLDLNGLTVRSITVNGRPATWTRSGDELTVTPRRGLRKGLPFITVVRYDGVPQIFVDPGIGEGGVFHTDDGMLIVGQPHVADTWFPVNDHPIDKASYTVRVSVPAGLEAVSNGVLLGRWTHGGWTNWLWHAKEPMASYLAMATVGQYDVRAYTSGGIRYWDALDPDLFDTATQNPSVGAVAEGSFARQPEIIRFLSQNFGRYPFSAAGGVVDDLEFGFALETQTRPLYDPRFFSNAVSGDAVVVHELAHQWYGNSLTIARWQDIWLNEGFATYAEWLWSERQGRDTAQEIFDNLYTGTPADAPFWTVVIGDPGPQSLFDVAVYDRGAMTLHQLRLAVGDATFFRILRSWASSQAGGHVTTPEFIAHAERIAGRQLDALFATWLFTPGRPAIATAPAVSGKADVHGTTVGPRVSTGSPRR
jgi:aminopeptidase N